ncbi:MAG: DUF5615 family PIN-like protein [Actinomycetota bacterium]|nr:DUF5615 family PIN-like protein [Actinomycetota bacterium]
MKTPRRGSPTAKRQRPDIRLPYDELLPWRVAESLRALEYRVSYVGNDQQPPRGSTDEDVLDPARKPNQVVVTSNHDMIMLCAEVGESGIWLDPRGRQLRREEHVVLAFTNIVEWRARPARRFASARCEPAGAAEPDRRHHMIPIRLPILS